MGFGSAVAESAGDRREVDMGREIRRARRFERVGEPGPAHCLERVAEPRRSVAVIDDQCRAALCGDALSDPAGDLDFLEKLAIWAQRWGPWSALDPPDGLLVDVTGVAHLFGGEARLVADAQAKFAARGLAARMAIAPTAGAAS